MSIAVNVFGSWNDAATIARQQEPPDPTSDDVDYWSSQAYLGVVLGIYGLRNYARHLAATVKHHPRMIDAFFSGLRWSSIEAKRRGRIDQAEKILEDSWRNAQRPDAEEADIVLAAAMKANFDALIATRRGDQVAAHDLVFSAIGGFEDHRSNLSTAPSAEALRYQWMALLNAAQLTIFSGDLVQALEELERIVDFSRRDDSRSLHTSLAVKAYVLIRMGRHSEAVPVLYEALDLLPNEYDPSVDVQIRKMLYHSYLELGMHDSAQRVAADRGYFWMRKSARKAFEVGN